MEQTRDRQQDRSHLLGKYMPYPFADGDYRLALGLVPMRLETWLDIDQDLVPELKEKARRLSGEYDLAFIALPSSLPGQAATLRLLLDHLNVHYPDYFGIEADRIENRLSGEVWRPSEFAHAPLDLAGRLIQEDLCLMSPGGDGDYLLSAGSVCFPLRWELVDKIGHTMDDIHLSVPGYADKLAASSGRYLRELKERKPSWRCNWTIVDAPDLYLKQKKYKPYDDSGITAENAGRKLWIRSERQTLRRLPGLEDILFTIRTYIRPLEMLEGMPDLARGLLEAIGKMPLEVANYKNLTPIRQAVVTYLERITS